MKLVDIKRKLEVYKIKDNNFVKEYPVNMSVNILKKNVKIKENDELLYLPYKLTNEQVTEIVKHLEQNIKLDFNKYFYVLECEGIYE